MTQTNDKITTSTPGAPSAYHPLTPQDRQVFTTAMQGFVGVKYTPLLVSTQVVAGIIYNFLCEASLPGSASKWQAIVTLTQAPGGAPVLAGISKVTAPGTAPVTGTLNAQSTAGGWSPYLPPTPRDRQVFTTALAGLLGVTYQPLLVSTQVVAGINYRFLATATIPGPGSSTVSAVLVEIYESTNGIPVLTDIISLPPSGAASQGV